MPALLLQRFCMEDALRDEMGANEKLQKSSKEFPQQVRLGRFCPERWDWGRLKYTRFRVLPCFGKAPVRNLMDLQKKRHRSIVHIQAYLEVQVLAEVK